MNFEWDPLKASQNVKKHNVHFADAVGVFEDVNALTIADNDHTEERFLTIGMDFILRLLVVAYSWRDDHTIRIISARKALPHERSHYEKQS